MTTTTRTELIAAIAAIGDHIDRHLGNTPGTAERAIYFWWWPPEDCAPETLQILHQEAQSLLAGLEAGQDLESILAEISATRPTSPRYKIHPEATEATKHTKGSD
jgi:hypothetical protein